MSSDIYIPGICTECGQSFDPGLPPLLGGINIPITRCDACQDKLAKEWEANEQRQATAAQQAAFWEQVPPLYRGTDKSRLPASLVAAVDAYEYGPTGLAFLGKAGEGKTRAAVLLLHRMAEAGKRVCYLPCTKFCAFAADTFADSKATKADARKALEKAARCHVLLLDDLGKNRMTERAEVELYDLLEHRTGHLLPTFWTSNSNAAALHAMFSPDRADAMIRRLGKEFCEHVVL
jgi:DNA replication protein DnaC/primosomal protein DnaI